MNLPLHGIRVLDLTRVAAGPLCTMILGDFGADVMKIEGAPDGDLLRAFGPFHEGEGTYFLSVNRNKRSVAVNLRTDEGRALIRELALHADVLVENFKPGVAAQMGLGVEELRRDNPGLIYASISGFGSTGPYGDWPGVDQIAQGMSGYMSVTGTEDSGPTRAGLPVADLTTGMWAALGILAALNERNKTGKGDRVETSLLSSLIGLLCVQGQRYLSLGEIAEPAGNQHPVICPYGIVDTADGPLNICVATSKMWVDLCKTIGCESLIDHPDYADNTARVRNRDALMMLLNDAFKRDTQQNWAARLISVGVPAGPIYRMDQVFSDPQVVATGIVETVHHPSAGELKLVGNPARLASLAGKSVRLPPPLLGEHSREALETWGIATERIDALVKSKVVQTLIGEKHVR
ncbi:CaiB/BaiF CoA transferase family protein [Caballeronia sp. 15711]|uniref:CaiB/BaiF CoA transferase family protein n=1 Tax=Caballeronia sp. 15711 TaxID=3391029 RepID=UPI0039E70A26